MHAWNSALRLRLDLLLEVHPPARFTKPVVTPETEYLFARWFITADPANKSRSIRSVEIVIDRIGLANQVEGGVRGLHVPVH